MLVRLLELVQVVLNVVIVVDVFFDLGSPFKALLIVRELLAVAIIEHYSDLAAVSKIEPELLYFDGGVVHVFSEILQRDSVFQLDRLASDAAGVVDEDTNAIVVVANVELKAFVVNWILVRLTFCLSYFYLHFATLDFFFQSKFDEWVLERLW